MNWLSVSSAPCGSRITAPAVHRVSAVDTTWAPFASTVATLASRPATVKRTDQRGRSSVTVGRRPRRRTLRGVRLSLLDIRVDGGGQVIAVAGHPDHPGAAVGIHLPTEQRAIERDRLIGVGGVQVAEVPRVGSVDQLGTEPAARLPQVEDTAIGVGTGRRPTGGAGLANVQPNSAR